MAQNKRIVVIGGSAAGPKAAARAKRLAPDAEVTIIQKSAGAVHGLLRLPVLCRRCLQQPQRSAQHPVRGGARPELLCEYQGDSGPNGNRGYRH